MAHFFSFVLAVREEKRERGRELKLLSTIYRDWLVGIRQAKNESPATRQGLCMGT